MIEDLKPLFVYLFKFASERLGFHNPPRLFVKQDEENSGRMLGRTAHYDPHEESITIFITNRHPKDILRSFAHELVHHTQKGRGDLDINMSSGVPMGPNYAQEDEHMRNMEKEAYLNGNMCFRDWEDSLKDKEKYIIQIVEEKFLSKEKQKMNNTKKLTREDLKKRILELFEKESNDLEVEEDEDVNEETESEIDLALEKIKTPEQEGILYESRFAPRDTRLFKKLLKEWIK